MSVINEQNTGENLPNAVAAFQLMYKMWGKLRELFGLTISFKTGLWLVRWDPETKIGIIRMDNITIDHVICCMAMIKKIKSQTVVIHTRKTTGTIKKARKLCIKYFNCEPKE